jgi:hypothetical protein
MKDRKIGSEQIVSGLKHTLEVLSQQLRDEKHCFGV